MNPMTFGPSIDAARRQQDMDRKRAEAIAKQRLGLPLDSEELAIFDPKRSTLQQVDTVADAPHPFEAGFARAMQPDLAGTGPSTTQRIPSLGESVADVGRQFGAASAGLTARLGEGGLRTVSNLMPRDRGGDALTGMADRLAEANDMVQQEFRPRTGLGQMARVPIEMGVSALPYMAAGPGAMGLARSAGLTALESRAKNGSLVQGVADVTGSDALRRLAESKYRTGADVAIDLATNLMPSIPGAIRATTKDVGLAADAAGKSAQTMQALKRGEKTLHTVQVANDPVSTVFIENRNRTTRPQYLSPLSSEDLVGSTVILHHNGTVGAVVTPQGDLQNVYNNGGPKGAGLDAVMTGLKKGAITLDAYDPYLPEYYRQFGFVETGRMKFNDAYAHPLWNFERDGRPDVVFMSYQGHGNEQAVRDRVANRELWQPNIPSGNYYDDYAEAQRNNSSTAEQLNRSRRSGANARAFERPAVDAAGNQFGNRTGGNDGRIVDRLQVALAQLRGGASQAGANVSAIAQKSLQEIKQNPKQFAALMGVVGEGMVPGASSFAAAPFMVGSTGRVPSETVMQRLYHGSPVQGITTFDRLAPRELSGKQNRWDSVGTWFTATPDEAQMFTRGFDAAGQPITGKVYEADVAIRNPKEYGSFNDLLDDFNRANDRPEWIGQSRLPEGSGFSVRGVADEGGNKFNEWLRAQGYDGIKVTEQQGIDRSGAPQTYYVALTPETQANIIGAGGTNAKAASPARKLKTLVEVVGAKSTDATAQKASEVRLARDVARPSPFVGPLTQASASIKVPGKGLFQKQDDGITKSSPLPSRKLINERLEKADAALRALERNAQVWTPTPRGILDRTGFDPNYRMQPNTNTLFDATGKEDPVLAEAMDNRRLQNLMERQVNLGLQLGGEGFYNLKPLADAYEETDGPITFKDYVGASSAGSIQAPLPQEMANASILLFAMRNGMSYQEAVDEMLRRYPMSQKPWFGGTHTYKFDEYRTTGSINPKGPAEGARKVPRYYRQKLGESQTPAEMLSAENQQGPVIDTHESKAALWPVGMERYIDSMTGKQYEQVSDLYRVIAQRLGIPVETVQAGRWLGGGPLTGLMSPRGDYVQGFEDAVYTSAKKMGKDLSPAALRKYRNDVLQGKDFILPNYGQND